MVTREVRRRGVHGLAVGATVCCPRGYKVGIIEKLEPECFRLAVPGIPNFWLGNDTVNSVHDGMVILSISLPLDENDDSGAPLHSGIHQHALPV